MLFNRLVKSKKDNLERYIFYRGLGYSVEASELLACVTYGDETLTYRMDGFSPDDRLRQLRGWLEQRREVTPKDALRAWYNEKHRRPEPRDTGGGLTCGSASFCLNTYENSIAPSYNLLRSRPRSLKLSRFNDTFCEESYFSVEELSYDAYEPIEEKSAKGVFTAPTSTFRMTTSTASMGILFNQLRSGRRIDLDQVRIERERITITRVYPAGTLWVFDLRKAGHHKMSRVRTRVMAEVIAEDLEILQDRRKYTLTRYRVMRPNGSVDYSYLYTIRVGYKDSIMAMHQRLKDRIRV